jgi:ABC-2 type transport system permease protein
VLAPLPISLVAIGKITAGMLNGLFAALLVFPIAAVVPATPVHLHVNWPVLLTLTPLALLTAAALGLTFGTRFEPRQVPILFGIIVLPLTFLGAIYYSWSTLGPVKAFGFSWLKWLVLVNPLVYISEGYRAALTHGPHMSLWAVYGALLGFASFLTWQGIEGFRARVVS